VDDEPKFLFQHSDLAFATEVVARGRYRKDGIEYDRLSLTLVRGDQLQSTSKHWVVRGHPIRMEENSLPSDAPLSPEGETRAKVLRIRLTELDDEIRNARADPERVASLTRERRDRQTELNALLSPPIEPLRR
jgi:hypothetical protein